MTIVADAGPLIALAKVDQLVLLQVLFGRRRCSTHRDVGSAGKAKPGISPYSSGVGYLYHLAPVANNAPNVKLATQGLDLGEAEAVALAAVQGVPLLIDDAAGRKAALKVGIQVIGTVGVLLHAKQIGHIKQVSPILTELRNQG